MKAYRITAQLIPALLLVMAFGCKKDERAIDLNISPVPTLFSPEDNLSIELNPAANSSETFEWEQAKAADGSLILYEVAFDQADGDFSHPFYTVVSDDGGVLNKLTLTHGDLNKIAELGGADFFEKKEFKWTVLASKGTNVVKADEERHLSLERPSGFAVIPGDLYLTGSATENGSDVDNALKMHSVAPGVFEIFTELKEGSYFFTDKQSDNGNKFYLFDNEGVEAIGTDGESDYEGDSKIFRITVNFNDINASMVEIKKVSFWYCVADDFLFDLPYVGNGVWRKDGFETTLQSADWGPEDRYKYRMVINKGDEDEDLWINSNFNDPAGQDGQYPSSEDYRAVNLTQNDDSQWDWGWKLDKNYITQGAIVDYWLTLNDGEDGYTQNYKKE